MMSKWSLALAAAGCAVVSPRVHAQTPCGCGAVGYHIHGTLPASTPRQGGATQLSDVGGGGGELLRPIAATPLNLGTFDINIIPTAALSANPAALAAFNRAAAQWEARISDPITININAGLAPLGAGILGSTSTVALQAPFDTFRDAMAADGADEPSNALVTAVLPTAATYSAVIPSGRTLSPNLTANKATLKALGFAAATLDAVAGTTSDASITFSTNFTFDFDNGNGVTPGQTDFETVASHEIGHALGFVSAVDDVNADEAPFSPVQATVLDLFRFSNNVTGEDPSTLADFATFPRNLVPGAAAITDDTVAEYAMSAGLTNAAFPGTDGRQASHWKADELTGTFLGMMDPTLGSGVFQQLTEADFRAMDLMGYEVSPVPEPSSLAIAGGAAFGLLARRRRA